MSDIAFRADHTQPAAILPPAGKWPAHDLEHVEACPLCGSPRRAILNNQLTDNVFFCSPGVWTSYRCKDCRCAYLNPRPNLASIGRAYQTYYTHDDLLDSSAPQGRLALLKRGLRNGYLKVRYGYDLSPCLLSGRWVIKFLPRLLCEIDHKFRNLALPHQQAALLDIGCGNGGFIRDANSWGWTAEGLDPDPKASLAGQKHGIRITTGSLPKTGYPDASFAAITMCHSIEHVHEPLASLREVLRILQPGGTVWVSTPNINSIGYKMFGKNWRGMEVPRHLVLFTPGSLKMALKKAGFVDVQQMRSAFNAEWYYSVSHRLTKGEDYRSASVLSTPVTLRVFAQLVNWLAFLFPQMGEEIILVAKRPG